MASARRILGLAVLAYGLAAAAAASGQTDAPMPDSPEARYFDFWPGTWVEVVDGAPDTAATTFTVTRGVHRSAFEERWKLVYDGAAHRSTALRAWDRVNERWMFTWVSDDGLFQVWEGRKFGDDWYIVREFEVDGERFLSRQAWIPRGRDELVRVMERSFDGGRSWETRSRTRFRRVSGPAAGARAVALTFDDLPLAGGSNPDLATARRVTDALLAALERRRAPAVGFVNEQKLERDGRVVSARVELLRRWASAGHELGNHGYSHEDLHATPLDEFQADVLRGAQVARRVMAEVGRAPSWFRHPYLHTGRDIETRTAFERFLAEHGYRVAPVTVDNYDYLFAAAYRRLEAAADPAAGRVVEEYLRYMERVVAYYEQQSRALLGREIPQVLLLHANALNAVALDPLLDMLERRGYEFITLERALRDPAFDLPDTYTGAGGITWLHRWALTMGKRGDFFAGEPEVPEWVARAAEGGEGGGS